jgi:hypothetical protein
MAINLLFLNGDASSGEVFQREQASKNERPNSHLSTSWWLDRRHPPQAT